MNASLTLQTNTKYRRQHCHIFRLNTEEKMVLMTHENHLQRLPMIALKYVFLDNSVHVHVHK